MKQIPSFEDFGSGKTVETQASGSAGTQQSDDAIRDAHDEGYKAGYADGLATADTERSKLTSDIATALQEASFTYFEARQHVMNSMRPLLETMADIILPELGRASLARKAVEELLAIADKVEAPIKLYCAEVCEEEISELVSRQVTFPVEIETEETLTSSQIILSYDNGQTHLDLDLTVAKIQQAISDFYETAQNEKVQHG